MIDGETEALQELGEALQSKGWKPDTPIALPFGDDEQDPHVLLALAFLGQFRSQLRTALCSGASVKGGVSTAADIATVIGEFFGTASGVPTAATIAACLAKYGLGRFCELTHRPA